MRIVEQGLLSRFWFLLLLASVFLGGCGGSGDSQRNVEQSDSKAILNESIQANLPEEQALPYGVSQAVLSGTFGQPQSPERIQAMAQKLSGYFNGHYANKPRSLALVSGVGQEFKKALAVSDVPLPVHRFYNLATGVHFFTLSEVEKSYVASHYPNFQYEGEAFFALQDAEASLSPVYRFYNLVSGTHFYTVSETEKNHVIASWPDIFSYEGISWYASSVEGAGWSPIYRFFNTKTGVHFYTASAAERDQVQAALPQFVYEGIGYYVRTAKTFRGQFVDAPVAGLAYQTATRSGVTDENGYFTYDIPNEAIGFSVGTVHLGNAKANSLIEVFGLQGSSDDKYGNKSVRVAQLLQSLDLDRGAGNVLRLASDIHSKVTAANVVDFNTNQAQFDTAVTSLLQAVQPASQLVSDVVARNRAEFFIRQTLTDCPLPIAPAPIGITAGANLSCLDRAKINYYQKLVQPLLSSQISGSLDQLALVEESWSEDAAARAIDINPVLAALNGIDEAVDAVDARDKGEQAGAAAAMAKMMMRFGQSFVDSVTVFTPTNNTSAQEALSAQRYSELAIKVVDGLANSVSCAAYLTKSPRKIKHADDCVAELKAIVEVLQKSQALNETVFSMKTANAAELKATLEILASAVEVAETGVEVLSVRANSPVKLRRAAFGMASATFHVVRDGVNLAYLNNKDQMPNTPWVSVAGTAFSESADLLLTIKAACYGVKKADPSAFTKCATTQAKEIGKSSVKSAFRISGSLEAIKHAGTMHEAIVAQTVLEELLWAGSSSYASVFSKYGITYDATTERSRRESFVQLITKIGLDKHDLNAVGGFGSWFSAWGSAVATGQNMFSASDTIALISSYQTLIEQNVIPDFWSPTVQLTATEGSAGKVNLTALVNPEISGFKAGHLVCHSKTSDHTIDSPWKSAIASLTSVSVQLTYTSGGTKGIYCVLYSGAGLFAGSNATALKVNLPAMVLKVEPTVATVGEPTVFTVTGTNLPKTAIMAIQDASCLDSYFNTEGGFKQVCTPLGTTGSKAVTVKTAKGVNGGAVIDSSRRVSVIAPLSIKYSLVGGYSKEECVKDSTSGLIWEGKPASGVRAGGNLYTNYDVVYYGTQTQMDSASNSYGFVRYVNSIALCGYVDWRLPTRDELLTLVDASMSPLKIEEAWFPNSYRAYWSSSPTVVYDYGTWGVNFSYGSVFDNPRSGAFAVRLVRTSQ